jgi:hypothetical protein
MNGLRRLRKMQSFSDGHKIAQLVQIHLLFPKLDQPLSPVASLFALISTSIYSSAPRRYLDGVIQGTYKLLQRD